MSVVLITQRVEEIAARRERRDVLDQQLVEFVLAAGFVPVPVPNSIVVTGTGIARGYVRFRSWLASFNPVGIVLSGGGDPGTEFDRDATERELMNFAKERSIGVLGICRGMQVMALAAGGRLHDVRGHVAVRHRVTGELEREVNSFHNMALASCPPGSSVLARSADGVIEAMRHKSERWVGCMWHPEREKPFADADLALIPRIFLPAPDCRVGRDFIP